MRGVDSFFFSLLGPLHCWIGIYVSKKIYIGLFDFLTYLILNLPQPVWPRPVCCVCCMRDFNFHFIVQFCVVREKIWIANRMHYQISPTMINVKSVLCVTQRLLLLIVPHHVSLILISKSCPRHIFYVYHTNSHHHRQITIRHCRCTLQT